MSTVVITGASGGLGQMLAMQFGSAGYNLILQHNHTEIGGLVTDKDIIIDTVKNDIRLLSTMNAIADLAVCKKANILINNAAVYLCKPFDEMTDCEIEEVIEVNLLSPMLLTRKLWHALKENNGVVVNINSIAGKEGGRYETAYSASKYGLAGFSKALQFDGTKDDVRVINVYVGKMSTAMTAGQSEQHKYIDPYEVSVEVFKLCQMRDSLRISEITLMRRNY